MVNAMPAIAWLIIAGVLFAAGEFFSKKFTLFPSWPVLFVVMSLYFVAALTWLPARRQKNELSITGALWSVISLLMTVLIGLLIFGERPSNIGMAGILAALVAVFLLSVA